LELAEDTDTPGEVRREALLAVANIEGQSAMHWLRLDERTFEKSVSATLSATDGGPQAWSGLRAIGLRRDARFGDVLRRALRFSDPVTRGRAALALAMVEKHRAREAVRIANQEAGSPVERVLTGLATLVVAKAHEAGPIIDRLRADLAAERHLYDLSIREDIISTLRSSTNSKAQQVAAAWEEIYADSGDWNSTQVPSKQAGPG
jgi:hypothetical protein